ncbi:MAG: hypothetical protein ACR2GY_13445 [Phycisphaerales bacterium]
MKPNTPDKAPDKSATTTPKTRDRTIDVDGMTGEACVTKLSTALKEVKGLDVSAVKVGNVSLRSATRDDAIAARAAIKTAGFEPRPAATTTKA